MASSFPEQISPIIRIIRRLSSNDPARHRMLDIGKGLGKYGFLTHEYVGLDTQKLPEPSKTLREQSRWTIDAVEIQPAYMWPHIAHIYETVHIGDVLQLYPKLPSYDVILMTDVIEHLDKRPALEMVNHFLSTGAVVLISTPVKFFHQDFMGSEWERHRSHWQRRDFRFAPYVVSQTVHQGRIYVLSSTLEPLPSHLNMRRIMRSLIDAATR